MSPKNKQEKTEEVEGNRVIAFFVERQLMVWMLITFLLLAGTISLLSLRRESFPNVNLHEIKVTTVYPGASPEDVEQFVTIPIEEKIREVEGLDQVRSISRHSVSEIQVRIDLDESNPQEHVDEVRRQVENVTDLPDLVTERSTFEERKSSNFPVLEIGLYGGKDDHELQQSARLVEQEIEKVKGVLRVDVFGQRDREWWVLADPKRMHANSVNLTEVHRAIRRKNVNIPGGTFSGKEAVNLRTTGEFETIKDLANLPVRTNDLGFSLRLGRIAQIKDTYERPELLARMSGKPAVSLIVIKKSRADQVELSASVKQRVKELHEVVPRDVNLQVINDEAKRTLNRLDVVTSNAGIGFALVLFVLIVFLSMRDAVITSLSLPLTIMGALLVFPVFDITFNMVSMLGLIVSLGMLVDNSIVISENIYRHRERGLSPDQAAIVGASELVKPIIGTYLTTIAAFMPMMFMAGVMGKFIWQIPFLVIATLTSSLLESFFLLPSRIAQFGRTMIYDEGTAGFFARIRMHLGERINRFSEWFKKLVELAIRARYVTLILIIAAFFSSIFIATQMRFSLFPRENSEIFVVKVEFPPNYKIERTMKALGQVEEAVRQIPKHELVSYVMKAGVQQINSQDVLSRYGEHLGMAHVYLKPQLERERLTSTIIDELKPKIEGMKDIVDLRIEEVVPSPPIGAAITVAVEGQRYAELRKIAAEVKDYLSTVKGVINIADDYKQGRKEVVVRLRDQAASRTGVDTLNAANVVRTAFEGVEASTLRQGTEEITIRVKYPDRYSRTRSSLGNIKVNNPYGLQTPLHTIISTETVTTAESLSHFDFERAITITADVDEKVITSNQANELILKEFGDMEKKRPGYRLAMRGEQENTKKSMASLAKAGAMAAFAIFAIIAIIFASLLRPMFIIGTIPLGLIGVILGFLLSGKALSFFALIGVIGLAGVVVNASIVLVDFINRLQDDGVEIIEALAEAARIRFRPIVLTTTTTLAGLLPTAYGVGGSDPVLIPMTLALAWGLAAGTLFALVLIPVLLAIAEDLNRLFGRKTTI